VPADRLVLVCTGSQGEPRAALSRIASDEHPHVVLERGDTCVFSSRTIPGNERPVLRLKNQLASLGVSIVDDENAPGDLGGPIHVSGHPCRGELARMYQWVRPRAAIPVHGEAQHMQAHALLARDCQVQHALVPSNGDVIRIARDGAPEKVGEVHSGRLAVEGDRLVPMDGDVIRARGRMLWNGAVMATVVVDRKGRPVGEPRLSAPGLAEEDEAALDDLRDAAADALRKAGRGADDAALEEAVRRAIRRRARDVLGKRPEVRVHLVRV